MDKTQINVERMRTCDAEWEEQKHPRAENGQFTSGSGSAGSPAKSNAEPAAKSPLKKAAAVAKGEKAAAGKNSAGGFAYTPEKKEEVLSILKRDMDSFGINSAVGKVNASLLNDLENGKSFTEAVNNAKAKYKGKGEEYDAQLYNFYVASKGPQWNENFMKDYGDKGSDYRSRKQALEREAEAWMDEPVSAPKQSPLQKAAAAVQGKSSTRLQKDLDAVAEDPHELEGILRERKAEIDRLTEELGRTKNGYKSQALHQEITRLKREYKEIDESI